MFDDIFGDYGDSLGMDDSMPYIPISIGELKSRYNKCKVAKVGDTITCPYCGSKFKKKHYQQKFCRSKGPSNCKDRYWNSVKPERMSFA